MGPFPAAIVAAAWLAAPLVIFGLRNTWKPPHTRRLLAGGALLVDVGTAEEYAREHLVGALSIPLEDLGLRQAELGEHTQSVITYARSHLRSAEAAQTLRGIGFHEVLNAGTLKEALGSGIPAESWCSPGAANFSHGAANGSR